ncbi:MAG: ABC transporter ATP-binding protein, partial [Myxococcales bacterium]|nr:ABC transporter ATP-binding protein [Myxococcales bacterium]
HGLGGRALHHRIDAVLDRVGLHGRGHERTQDLPGGMRQRVALAGAILHEPAIVFLDEPTAGVDPWVRRRFWSIIRELSDAGTTIFVTTHYMDEAELCGRVGLMVAGRLPALDTPEGLKRTHVPGRVWSVPVPGLPLEQARARLAALPGVLAVQTMGAGLRVRVRDDAPTDGQALARVLPDATEITPDAATLEDVFLAVVDAEAQSAGTAAAFGGA